MHRLLLTPLILQLVPLQDIPSMMCFNCNEKLANAYAFRQLCQVAFTTNVVKVSGPPLNAPLN